MTRLEWIIKVLSESANEKLPVEYKKWLFDNIVSRNIRVNVEDCVCNELEWTHKYKGTFFVQEEKTILGMEFVDTAKSALILVPLVYDLNTPCYFAYWYNPSIKMYKNTAKAEKVAHKVRHFNLPTFEEWQKKDYEVEVLLGAYKVEIGKFSWSSSGVRYAFAMSLSNCNPHNIYTDKLFSGLFDYEYKDDISKLKSWYDSTVATFYDFWEQYINAIYLEPDV